MNTAFLLEIGTEELPAKSLQALSQSLAENLQRLLTKAEISYSKTTAFATPRRLAVLIEAIATTQKDQQIERKGPAVAAAFDANGNPTPACLGFARACGVDVANLQRKNTEKGEFLFFNYEQKGALTQNLLPELIKTAIKNLPIPKPMRWNSHTTEFVRPVHWITLLFGHEVMRTEILGLTTHAHTYGHRFLHPKPIELKKPADYAKKLKTTGKVIAHFEERKENIRQKIFKIERKIAAKIIIDEDLLDEVTGLVEWPVALLGRFAERFLEVPPEVLMTAMKTHQKYFPVVNQKNQLLPQFITISNINSKNPARVIAGNERVMQARLSDASFFYHEDLKHTLESRLEKLKNLMFQNKLGSMYEKSERLGSLAKAIARALTIDDKTAERAALLSKADLLSEMVGEFPELQGIMGYYYALQDQEKEAVALAIKEHYLPRFAGDTLPESAIGCMVALADRLDTLIGIFGIHQMPTGEKDPFGLRRAALSSLRILIEKQLPLDLKNLLEIAQKNYQKPLENNHVVTDVFAFMMERLRAWYAEQAISADVFAAVFAREPTQPLDFHHRLLAVQHFCSLPEAESLIAANKRVSNILKKEAAFTLHNKIEPGLFEEPAEHALADLLGQKTKEVEQLCHKAKYTEALVSLAALQKPVDEFFDHVLVMSENQQIRTNRFALLSNLRNLFLLIADISLISNTAH